MINKIKNLNGYLADAAPEALAAFPRRFLRLGLGAFPAFEDRNYRRYFTGQFISLVGSWLQIVAQGWLVFELTHSAFWVGFVAALSSLPILFFGLIAGVMVDRFSTKSILYLTQILPMIFAALLGVLTLSGTITLWQIVTLAFLFGVVNSLEAPARQTFVANMVGRQHLASAIALNAAAFNSSRVLGPSAAGILIALIGTGGTFLINAASFLAVIGSLTQIRVNAAPPRERPQPIAAVKEGLLYTFSHRDIRLIMAIVPFASIFGWAYAAILPVIASEVFGQNAAGLGYLHTAVGLGALGATLLVSLFISRIGPRPFILGGNALIALSLFAFSFVRSFEVGLGLMFLTGLALISQFSVMNSVVQHSIRDSIRGRAMSIYVTLFRGTMPFGAFMIGYLGDYVGPQWAVRLMALPLFATLAVLIAKRRLIPRRLEEGMAEGD